jgi:hypothetical protein
MAMPQTVEQPARTPSSPPLAARIVTVLVLGLLASAVTSILQKYLGSPWGSLVNAASPWLAVMFAAGLRAGTGWDQVTLIAALAGRRPVTPAETRLIRASGAGRLALG